jgi:hypothetical protein
MFLNLSYYSGFNPGANLQKKELPLYPVKPISLGVDQISPIFI